MPHAEHAMQAQACRFEADRLFVHDCPIPVLIRRHCTDLLRQRKRMQAAEDRDFFSAARGLWSTLERCGSASAHGSVAR
jgi:hypothetical protein